MKEKYQPVFTNISTDISERWKLLMNFIEIWYKINIPSSNKSGHILDIEQRIGLVLPSSLVQYINLALQLQDLEYFYPNGGKSNAFSEIFRDCLEIKLLENHQAISLMIQGEGDFYWGVKIDDFNIDDPKVYGYQLDYECLSHDKFDPIGEIYPTLTSFVLNHLFCFLRNNSISFGSNLKDFENIYKELKSNFVSHSKFDGTEIFESENMIAFIQDKHSFSFHIWDKNKKCKIPEIIFALEKTKRWCNGDFYSLQ